MFNTLDDEVGGWLVWYSIPRTTRWWGDCTEWSDTHYSLRGGWLEQYLIPRAADEMGDFEWWSIHQRIQYPVRHSVHRSVSRVSLNTLDQETNQSHLEVNRLRLTTKCQTRLERWNIKPHVLESRAPTALFVTSKLALPLTSARRVSFCIQCAAACNGVQPSLSWALTFAPALSRRLQKQEHRTLASCWECLMAVKTLYNILIFSLRFDDGSYIYIYMHVYFCVRFSFIRLLVSIHTFKWHNFKNAIIIQLTLTCRKLLCS